MLEIEEEGDALEALRIYREISDLLEKDQKYHLISAPVVEFPLHETDFVSTTAVHKKMQEIDECVRNSCKWLFK